MSEEANRLSRESSPLSEAMETGSWACVRTPGDMDGLCNGKLSKTSAGERALAVISSAGKPGASNW